MPALDRSPDLASTARNARRMAGFSLIELLIVIVILALAATGTTMAIGALTRSKMRAGCMQIVAASRFAYARSVSKSSTVRLVFDVDGGTMKVEEAHGDVTLSRDGDQRRRSAEDGEDDASSVDPWEAARERLEHPLEPSLGRSPFGPVLDPEGRPYSMSEAAPFGEGVRVVRVITPHDSAPRESGKASIYFFSGGNSEHAVVQLENARHEVFSVEIQPLTGRARVHSFAYEPESLTEDDEVRDPG